MIRIWKSVFSEENGDPFGSEVVGYAPRRECQILVRIRNPHSIAVYETGKLCALEHDVRQTGIAVRQREGLLNGPSSLKFGQKTLGGSTASLVIEVAFV